MNATTLTPATAVLSTTLLDWIDTNANVNLLRPAFRMPIKGVETLVLFYRKNREILLTDDIPDAQISDSLTFETLDGDKIWILVDPPEGADIAYETYSDTQNLEDRAVELDTVVAPDPTETEHIKVTVEVTGLESNPTADSELDLPEDTPSPVLHQGVTMEQLDNAYSAAMSDLDSILEDNDMPLPVATPKTLTAADIDPNTLLPTTEDRQIANEIMTELAMENTQDEKVEEVEAPATTPVAKDKKPKVAPKASAAAMPLRDRIVSKLLIKLGLASLTPPEKMFAKFTDATYVKWIAPKDLAVFNNMLTFEKDRTEVGRTLNEIADWFGSENILNEAAEVKTTRVVEVAAMLLRRGRQAQIIKAALIPETTIPEAVKGAHADINEKVFQVWDGRHRAAALALLYGKDVLIPILVEDMTFSDAYDEALISNDSRAFGKKEAAVYFGLTSEIQSGNDIAGSFAICKGVASNVAKWVQYQTIGKRETVLEVLEVPVFDAVGKGIIGMTTPSYGNILASAFTALGKDSLKDLDTAKPVINDVISTIKAMWEFVKVNAPERINNIWTSYGTKVLGKVIGEAILKAMAAEVEYNTDCAIPIMQTVLAVIATDANTWNNTKPSVLFDVLHSTAVTKNLTIPRLHKAKASILQQ